MCWCLSENIAKQQQLTASPPERKVRALLAAVALAARPPLPSPDPQASALSLEPAPA